MLLMVLGCSKNQFTGFTTSQQVLFVNNFDSYIDFVLWMSVLWAVLFRCMMKIPIKSISVQGCNSTRCRNVQGGEYLYKPM